MFNSFNPGFHTIFVITILSPRKEIAPFESDKSSVESTKPQNWLKMKTKTVILSVVFLFLVILAVVLAVVLTKSSGYEDSDSVLVEAPAGQFRGVKATDGDYAMFMGIPYGSLNQSNPFGASTLHPKIEGIFEADSDSIKCPQIEEYYNTFVGEINCLTLNVYKPNKATPTKKLPVMIYVYGGAFKIGFAGRFLYGPSFLVRHDVILVTINYRQGAYGFMCHHTPEVPGNQGLKDQILSLQWAQENIAAFGGDPNEITIFGNSAGAASIDYLLHYAPPNLFKNVILQSGTLFAPGQLYETSDRAVPMLLCEALGYKTDTLDAALEFLAKADAEAIIEATKELGYKFHPCIEAELPGVYSLITVPPKALNPQLKDKAILSGHNNYEGYQHHYTATRTTYVNQYRNHFYNELKLAYPNLDNETLWQLEYVVRHHYIGNGTISFELRDEIAQLESDIEFVFPISYSIDWYLEHDVSVLYKYVFTYLGGRNFIQYRTGVRVPGALHADELGYLFNMEYITETITPEDQLIIDRMTMMWTNFAKYRDPTPNTTELLPVKWEPYTNDTKQYLHIDRTLALENTIDADMFKFWYPIHRYVMSLLNSNV